MDRLEADYARSHPSGGGSPASEERPLVVALVGSTGAGKSTLLNALAGRPLATEGGDRPTSREATAYAPDDVWVEDLEMAGAQLRRYSPLSIPRGAAHVYVDTPDLNSVEAIHRDRARQILEKADVAIVVMHRGSVAEASQADLLEEFARRRKLVFVVNFADSLGAAARADLKAQALRLAEERWGPQMAETPAFAVSAREAKRDPSGFEFPALESLLRAWAQSGTARALRRSNGARILSELAERVEEASTRFNRRLEVLSQQLDRDLAGSAKPLNAEFENAVRVARRRLRDLVRDEAGAAWWGPGGWWLRLSLLGKGSMGAAALLARGSLPWGLAAAAAGTALSRLQAHSRSRAADARVGDGETDEETGLGTASAIRSALAAARTIAAREGLAPEEVALPSPERVVDQVKSLRMEAWRYTAEQAVPEVVGRWWKWARLLLIPLVNLPLLALAADVGYRVVRGYWTGLYLGADYFLNAFALAGLLSAGGAVLATLSLSSPLRRLQRLAVARFEASYALYRRELSSALGASLHEARVAAQALRDLVETLGAEAGAVEGLHPSDGRGVQVKTDGDLV